MLFLTWSLSEVYKVFFAVGLIFTIFTIKMGRNYNTFYKVLRHLQRDLLHKWKLFSHLSVGDF